MFHSVTVEELFTSLDALQMNSVCFQDGHRCNTQRRESQRVLTQDSAERPREGPARRPLRAGRAGGFIGLGLPARVPCEGIPEALLLGRCSCAALAEIFVDSGSEKAENTLSWSLHSDSVRRPPEDPAHVTTQGRLRLFWSACLALGTHAAFPAPPSERVPL